MGVFVPLAAAADAAGADAPAVAVRDVVVGAGCDRHLSFNSVVILASCAIGGVSIISIDGCKGISI